MSVRTIALLMLGAAAGLAQQYEIGGAVGGAFAKNSTVSSPAGSATAGFNNGAGFSVLLGSKEALSAERSRSPPAPCSRAIACALDSPMP
jgi:hypothetical protein